MRENCPDCNGNGKIQGKEKKCPVCNGYGSTKVSLTDLTADGKPKAIGPKCSACNGTGLSGQPIICPTCNGSGHKYYCEICHKPTTEKKFLCPDCYQNPVVYVLKQPLDFNPINNRRAILGTVMSYTSDGVRIDLNSGLEGFIPRYKLPKSINLVNGQEIPVKVTYPDKLREYMQKRNPPLELTLLRLQNYNVQPIRRNLKPLTIQRITSGNFDNKIVILNAEVMSVKVTSGPTTFNFSDELGDQINGVAFVDAGVRAYPNISEGLVVQVVSKLSTHRGNYQLDIQDMTKLNSHEYNIFIESKKKLIIDKSSIDPNFKFLIDSELLENLKPDLVKVAQRIRTALLVGQPILMKYHHPCVDGACAGVALELAILGLMGKNWEDDTRNILKKIPARDPVYSPQDATRDILTMLEEEARFGFKYPLVILVDFGSSKSQISQEIQLKGYNIDIIVIDHHTIDESTKEYVNSLVNPLNYSDEYRISAGMLAVEIARMIFPHPKFGDSIKHLAAISGTSDRVIGSELDQYKQIVSDSYPEELIWDIIHALNYVTYNLRFGDGSLLFYDVLAVNQRHYRQKQLVPILAIKAKNAIKQVVIDAKVNCRSEIIQDNKLLIEFDLANYVNYGNFPQPSKIIGNLHDSFVKENPEKLVLTVGIADTYMMFRIEKFNISVSEIMKKILEKYPNSGLDGGG
ncbi:MAG: DHH family phosphoesterase, partial [Candidatus Heimdallarchaeota archaeon]